MMPIFANSATVTVRESLVLRDGSRKPLHLGVRFGVWVHPVRGPVLIDTGYGPEVVRGKRSLSLRVYAAALKPRLKERPEAVLERLGFSPGDVSTIVITHFHADHISGLRRFPNARFVAAGWLQIKASPLWRRLRHGIFTELLPSDFEDRLTPLETLPTVPLPFLSAQKCEMAGTDILGDGRLLALDLPGHAKGHIGLVWPDHRLIYAADAQWLTKAIVDDRPPRGPARLVYDNEGLMRRSLETLRSAKAQGYEIVTCHDPID